jgi:hypothetical protein
MANVLIGNRGGIPTVRATQSSVGSATADASYTLPDHTFRFIGPAGLVIVTFSDAVTGVLGIDLVVNESTLALTDAEGDPLTEITAGDHLITFNKVSNTIKLVA